jgi:hypothetical protein
VTYFAADHTSKKRVQKTRKEGRIVYTEQMSTTAAAAAEEEEESGACVREREACVFGNWASVAHEQGDQIGRIFTHWAIVYFLQFLGNYRSSLRF